MCELCNNNVCNCKNCYWGQVETKNLFLACEECVGVNHIIPTEWRPLGDTYCRKCGRKLKEAVGIES